ncbi:MAG: replication-associated recombination protein A, partial [Deltaproteobacteria bacterium]|nr:replication-associated recombination protein A [Deltaproteobacteria bacterium]
KNILLRALEDKEKGLGNISSRIDDDVADIISAHAHGDARWALNTLEASFMLAPRDTSGTRLITKEIVIEALQKKFLIYDRNGEEHYNVISAFIKAMRGSDPDAALYWLARMLEAGEDPLFIARRMVIFASEDIGNGDPDALSLAISVKDAVMFIGMPEGWIPLAQGVVYLSTAPKSNASYTAYLKALEDVKEKGSLPVPLHIRNAPTRLMKDMGYSKDYKYPHNYEHGFVREDYFPDALKGRVYYKPTDRGCEKMIKERMEGLWKKRSKDDTER